MNLIIDIGNTIVKVAVFKAGNLMNKEVLNYSDLHSYLSLIKFKKGIVSNVGNEDIENQILSSLPSIISMSNPLNLPIKSSYESMETLGKDRLANAVGAFVENPNNNSLVIDVGSCITFDFIDENNCYQGGAISPGLNMRFKALNYYTEKLPLLTFKSSNISLIAKDTNSSIVSGVVNGIKAEIQKTIEKFRLKYPSLTIFMTGGDTEFLQSIVEIEKNGIFAVENLTLIGLNNILETNVQ